jgi:hypothetical protein
VRPAPYSFVAEDLGAFYMAKTVFALTGKESNAPLSVRSTGDVMLIEVAPGGPGAGWVCWSLHSPVGACRQTSLFVSACQGRFIPINPPGNPLYESFSDRHAANDWPARNKPIPPLTCD